MAQDVVNQSGQVLIPRGSPAELVITQVSDGGVAGTRTIALQLRSVTINGNRREVTTVTEQQSSREGLGANRRTAETVGGGAALGALLGAVIGGGQGAAVGAAVGAAGGAAAQVLTRGDEVRVPAETAAVQPKSPAQSGGSGASSFTTNDILRVIDRRRADVGIVTLAPEIPGGLELTRALVAGGVRVSLGHSGATFEEAQEAIGAGARQATHLFNRMRPLAHRDPGLVGAALASEDLAVEIICDGLHVHPAVMRLAVAAKGPSRTLAISDATAGAGLPAGAKAMLGGQPITVDDVARLDDGTMAGSVLTMDRAFAALVTKCGFDLVQAAEMCATTPARELGLVGHGVIAPGAIADLTVISSRLEVVQTWVGGVRIWPGREPGG